MKTVTIQGQQKWEYAEVSRKTETALVIALNEVGEQGWEMTSVFHYKDAKGVMTWTAFVKRPKSSVAAKVSAAAGAAASADQAAPPSTEPAGFDLSGEVFEIKKS